MAPKEQSNIFSIVIDKKTIQDLSQIDAKITSIEQKSKSAAKNYSNAFTSMGTQVNSLLNSLTSVEGILGKISKLDIGKSFNNVANTANNLDNMSNSATTAAEALNRANEATQNSGKQNEKAKSYIASFNEELKKINDNFKKYADIEEYIAKVNALASKYDKVSAVAAVTGQNIGKVNKLSLETIKELEKGHTVELVSKDEIKQAIALLSNLDSKAKLLTSDGVKSFTIYTEALNKYKTELKDLKKIESQKKALDYKDIFNMSESSVSEIKAKLTELKRFQESFTFDNVDNQALLKQIDDLKNKLKSLQTIAKQSLNFDDVIKLPENSVSEITNKIKELQRVQENTDIDLADDDSIANNQKLLKQIDDLKQKLQSLQKVNVSYDDAMDANKNAKSISQRIDAINKLKIARNNLSKDTENYNEKIRKLNEAIASATQENDKLINSSNKLSQSHSKVLNTADQLTRKLALMFSVSQISGYISKLAQVRGEFELQQRALQAILQNKDEANRLFGKITDLAIRSPFQLKELITYTKQLAAYRIETDKLYDTTKRLADVSAGLGVDMQRLILAYGQVKAANYLRGTELRQFSEAGINILGELSAYFTETEKQIVSVADVFERVSNRLVRFSDVEEVFRRLTDESGIFYNMQEIQAETLKGQISNLNDALDIMLNNIGKKNEGVLKGSVQMARFLVENYEKLVYVLEALATILVMVKLHSMQATKHMGAFYSTSVMVKGQAIQTTSVLKLMSVQFAKLGKSIKGFAASSAAFIKGNAWLIAIGAIVRALSSWWSWNNEIKEQIGDINKKYDALKQTTNKIYLDFNLAKNNKDIDTQKIKLQQLIDIANKDYTMNIDVNLEGATEANMSKIFDDINEQISYVNAFSKSIEVAFVKTDSWINIFRDDFSKELNKLGESAVNANSVVLNELQDLRAGLFKIQSELTEEQKKAFDELNKPRISDKNNADYETELEYLERLKKAYHELFSFSQDKVYIDRDGYNSFIRQLNEMGVNALKLNEAFTKLNNNAWVTKAQFTDFTKEIDKNLPINLTDKQKTIYLKTSIDKLAAQQEWNEFTTNYIYKWIEEKYNIKFTFSSDENKKELLEWQKRLNEKADELSNELQVTLGVNVKEDDSIKLDKKLEEIVKLRDTFKKELESYVIESSAFTDNQAKAEAEVAIKELSNKIKGYQGLLDFFGYKDKTKKSGRTAKDKTIQNQIDLMKKLNDEYERQRKNFTIDDSTDRTLDAYQDVIEMLKMSEIINENTQLDDKGIIEALKQLRPIAAKIGGEAGKEARIALEKAISGYETQLDIDVQIKGLNDLQNEINDMFSNYEMSLKLEDKGLGGDFFAELFDIDKTSLKDIEDKLHSNEIKNAFFALGEDGEAAYQKFLDDSAKASEKATKERLVKYAKYLKESVSERIQIELEGRKQIDEVLNSKDFSNEQKDKIKKRIDEEMKEKIDKSKLEEFMSSDLYLEMFSDMSNVSNKTLSLMKTKIDELKNTLGELSPESLKTISDMYNNISDEMIKRNPYKVMTDSLSKLKALNAEGKNMDTLSADLSNEQAKQDDLNETIRLMELAIAVKDEQIELFNLEGKDRAVVAGYQNEELKTLEQIVAKKKEELQTSKKNSSNIIKDLQTYKDAAKSLEALKDQWGKLKNMVNSAGNSIISVLEASGKNTDGLAEDIVSLGMGLVDSIFQAIMFGIQLELLGVKADILSVKMNAALGIIGWIVIAIQALATIITAIFNIHDKTLDRKIQDNLEKVKKLGRAYEELKTTIENAFNIDTLDRTLTYAHQNLSDQIANLYENINKEQDKKKVNQEKVADYQQQIWDKQAEEAELFNNTIKNLAGIGTDGVDEAAQSFVDAWYDAFLETGNGLEGLKEQWNEYFDNIVKKQLMLKATENFLKPIFDQLDAMFEKKSEGGIGVTPEEMQALLDKANSTFPELSAFLEELATGLGAIGGSRADDLSLLQQGIQNITETTAGVIESYLNSIRFEVFSQTTILRDIQTFLSSDGTFVSPIVNELKIQTNIMNAMYVLIDGVIYQGHTKGGSGLKVFID